jgi:A/G-specific adenine glycosylase
MIDEMTLQKFQLEVWDYYHKHGRHDLPWRASANEQFDPYRIVVSEIMLQQTQVSRVLPKYREFIATFPTVKDLAEAPLGDVLRVWSGLGYNRRAKYLHQAAQKIQSDYGGVFPQDAAALTNLPGVGVNTAGAISAYAFNRPALFIETNIRTVFIHHFFQDQDSISDREVLVLVAQTLPQDESLYREWYWALTDYGSNLKKVVGNAAQRSKHYVRQSIFVGSRRQLRGQVLKLLGDAPLTEKALTRQLDDARLPDVLQELIKEGMVQRRGSRLSL